MSRTARPPLIPAIEQAFGSARFAAVLTQMILGALFAAPLLRALLGWAGLLGIVVSLVVLAAFSMIARRAGIDWHGLLPVSLLVFIGWCGISVIWSDHQWATLAGALYQVAVAFLGVYVALVRDTIQALRAVGDVLRVLLTASIALEILAGLLIDMPIAFLGIAGNLDRAGPIQGIFGSRNLLGFICAVAVITFILERRTRSVRPATSAYSLVLGIVCLLLTRSPVAIPVAVTVGLAALALYTLRRVPAARRPLAQWVLLTVTVVVTVSALLARGRLVQLLNAGSEFEVRYSLWQTMGRLGELEPLVGWGWLGAWRSDIPPYSIIEAILGRPHASGLNAFLDVQLQVGLVGLSSFVVLVGVALVRTWLLASDRRSAVYVWPALLMVILLTTSGAESIVLVEGGWLLLVLCAVKGARDLSWRRFLPQASAAPGYGAPGPSPRET